MEGFDGEKLDAVAADLKKIDDKTYGEGGRSDVRMLTDDLGAMYAGSPGTSGAWAEASPSLGPRRRWAARSASSPTSTPGTRLTRHGCCSPRRAISRRGVGVALTVLEHTMPLRELLMQANRLKGG